MRGERDLPKGHPSASDFVPGSRDAKRYAENTTANLSERDLPLGHPRASDNPDLTNATHPLETSRDYSRPHTILVPSFNGIDPDDEETREKYQELMARQGQENPAGSQ